MALYTYTAVKPDGETIEGEMDAVDHGAVIQKLKDEGCIPIRAVPLGGAVAGVRRSLSGTGRRGIGHVLIMHFTGELATLLEAGLTLDRSLQILGDLSEKEEVARLAQRLQDKVRSGASFSAALADQGAVFSPLYINTVRAGEAGGAMQHVLARLAEYMERSHRLRENIRSALVYPLILLTVAGLSVVLLLTFVVPQFSQMFDEMGQALPLPTQIVIGIGELFRAYWWLLLGVILLLAALGRSQLQRPEVRYRWDRRVLTLPLFGELVAKVETARFARTLGTLLENGLPLLMALRLVRDVISNGVIAEGVGGACDLLERGRGLADPLIEQGLLPPLALQMIKVGEESGNLGPTLFKIADIYDEEVSASVKRMLTLLEPVLIVGLGVIVAGIIISILLAVLSANQLAF